MTASAPASARVAGAWLGGSLARFVSKLGAANTGLIAALIVLSVYVDAHDSHFFTVANMKVIGTSVSILGVLAVGETVIMLLGGLDISIGSTAGLTSVVTAMVFMSAHSSIVAIGVGLLVGAACGAVNAVVIVYGRVNAVIATLATYAAFRGVANLVSNGSAQGYTGSDSLFGFLDTGTVLGLPVLIWIFGSVVVLAHVVLTRVDVGRNVVAMGGNATAARLSGLAINRYVVSAYVVMGLLAAVGGVLLTARTGSGEPVSGSQGLELQAITAVALGGCSLSGGRGSVVGTVLAVCLLGVLTDGLTMLGANAFYQDIAQGSLLVAAVILQNRRRGQRAVGLPD